MKARCASRGTHCSKRLAHQIIVDLDLDVVTHTLPGGLLTYVLTSFVLGGEDVQPPALDRADAVVEVIMSALTPGTMGYTRERE